MKHIFTLLMIILFANLSQAQNENYSEFWKSVEKLEQEGLPKSAQELVEKISSKADTEKNSSQQIKVLMFKSKYALTLEEDAQLKIINDFKKKIAQSDVPTSHILENILANLYWQYFQQNRWKFYNRTKTENKVDPEDFRTWDLQTLFDEVHVHFQRSLQNGLLLQLQDLKDYDVLINVKKDSKIFRPTLYDFLAQNALEFYKTDEHNITSPAYKFEIDDRSYLDDAASFSELKISSKDASSLQLNALKIYQDLIKFHLKDDAPYALADVNIQRLLYVSQHAIFNDKEAILIEALKTESSRLRAHEVSGLYDFELATIYNQQGLSYQPIKNEEPRWQIKEALELCDATIKKFPNSTATKKCSVLKQSILQKSLQIISERFLPIQKNSKLLLRYKNFDQLYFTVYQLSRKQYERLQNIHRKEEQLSYIKKLNVETQWQSTLRNEHDYQTHSTEIILPRFDNGYYLIFGSPEANKENTFAFSTIHVTDLALVDKSEPEYGVYQVIDRNNGQPIANAKIIFNFRVSNNNEETVQRTTNSNGEIRIKKPHDRNWSLNIEVTYRSDKAYFDNYYLNRYYKNKEGEKVNIRSFLFTDRSIYRPAQTIYFKGILMQTEDSRSSVIPNEKIQISLYDVNNQEVSKLELVTNEFGSYNGVFILPNNGLTGQYYIRSSGVKNVFAPHYFSVEEYKRPKFETKFNPVTETYKVNDFITVKGEALAYGGSNITDAKVVYRVHRKVQYPRWFYWYRPWFVSDPQEITHGETTTDDSGNFEITFKARPDESVDKTNLPIFNYEIIADVTDINGETRSTTTIVNVGYHALSASISVASKLDKSKKDHKLTLETKNLNGEFVPAKGSIKIYKLIAPNFVLRKRPWNAPDYQEIPESEFKQLFPHDAYNNEDNSNFWKKGKLVLDRTFNTETSTEFELRSIKKWASGQYVIVLETKDKFGQVVKDEAKTTLYMDSDGSLADKQLFRITTNKEQYDVGDNVVLKFASAAPIRITVDIEKDHKIINTQVLELNDNSKIISIPVAEKDVGGFAVHYSFAAYNSFRSSTMHINVPYPRTDLEIETLTFRDKLQPGEDETWSFKIMGPKGDQVSAELLAGMYDMSLDQFKTHNWTFNPIANPIYYSNSNRNGGRSFGNTNFRVHLAYKESPSFPYQGYDELNWFGFYFGQHYYRNGIVEVVEDSMMLEEVAVTSRGIRKEKMALGYAAPASEESEVDDFGDVPSNEEETPIIAFDDVQIRKNFQETAFFFPQLQTDEEGNVSFSFTTPEALTKWKLQLVAHTKTLESATSTLETVTQKELMIIPNVPRFLRQGDQITISSKIANISDKMLEGHAILQLFDALTGTEIDEQLDNSENTRSFSVDANGNTQVAWNLSIPDDVQAVQFKVIAKAGDFSDGEQNALPVLTNRMLVTETMPMWIRSNQSKTFTLDKLKNNSSSSLKHHNLTLEMTSNPAWYAVQALPYLMEYPHECNEQVFARYYANALGAYIANSNPRIQEVFDQWRNTDALLSNLEKNQELKSILIQETPWLRDAQSETEQKKRIGLLFDLNKMNSELESSLRKLQNNQMSNGAWPWFKGGYANRNITQHIVSGFLHLEHLEIFKLNKVASDGLSNMLEKAMSYLDAEFVKEYHDIRKYNKNVDLSKDHLTSSQLHYLYIRSFDPEAKVSNEVKDIMDYYHSQIRSYWLKRSLYQKGLMALIMHRTMDEGTSGKIMRSLKETSITSDELGMYWKENTNSWYWYQAPIETQALMIEVFSEIENDVSTIDNLKIWLLKNKQTNQWKTTKATTEAVYALLLNGSSWLSVTDMVDVIIGNSQIDPQKLEDVSVEAGTGYYKTSWSSAEIKPEMADVQITKKGEGIAWGSLYWQYFEDLDKITSAETPLQLKKKLFLKSNTDKGEELSEISKDTKVNVGDLIRVRIELRSDRSMEFIHMKDMRASGLEPVNVISQYKWQDGLGYYESTKDASTNFFFDHLPKGVYIFEYDLRVNNSGEFSNGITTIQSMYAPEFSSHSEGVRISVD